MDTAQTLEGEVLQETFSPKLRVHVSDFRTVRVSNLSLSVSGTDILELFTYSGKIQYIEMMRETETTQAAYITFSNSQGADSAAVLTGSTLAGLPFSITLIEDYQLPPHATLITEPKASAPGSVVKMTEDVVSTTLAKGFVLGKDVLKRAKSLDKKHQWMVTASATVASIDRKMGLSEKLSMGTAVVNETVKEMDELLQVLEVKSALAAAEQKVMSIQYVSAGASWVSNAFNALSKAAEDVSVMTKEKVDKAEEEKRETLEKERAAVASDFVNAPSD